MTNGFALFLGFVIVAALLADAFLNGGEAALFVVRRFLALVHWVEFWR